MDGTRPLGRGPQTAMHQTMHAVIGQFHAPLLGQPLLDFPITTKAFRLAQAGLQRRPNRRRQQSLPRAGAPTAALEQTGQAAMLVAHEPRPDRRTMHRQMRRRLLSIFYRNVNSVYY